MTWISWQSLLEMPRWSKWHVQRQRQGPTLRTLCGRKVPPEAKLLAGFYEAIPARHACRSCFQSVRR